MKNHLRHALQTGLVFGIIIVFLFLIGFTNHASAMVGNGLQTNTVKPGFGLDAKMFNLLIFFALLGIWAGIRSSRRAPGGGHIRVPQALVNGLVAGLVSGLTVGGLAYLIGTLNGAKVRMSTYLAQLLPETIKLFTLGKLPAETFLWYLLLFIVSGLLGGLIGFVLVHEGLRKAALTGWNKLSAGVATHPAVERMLGSRAFRPTINVVLLLVLFLVPLQLSQFWNYTLGTVGIYVLLGLGLNIVVGLSGLLDLGYVAFFAIGAYTVALLTAPAPHHLLWSFWVALPIGVVLAGFAGVLLGVPVLRMRGDYLAIVTLGFGEIIRILSKSDLLTSFTGGPKGVLNVGGPGTLLGFLSSELNELYLIIVLIFLAIFMTLRLQHSRVGRAWEAMREDETVAGAMGINTLQHKLMAFGIGAAFAGLGGVLFASRNQFTGPEDFNLMVSINVLAVVIVGGMGSIPGVIAGAFVLKGIPEILREMENYRIILFGALLVVMMLLRPEGLFPSSRRKMEIHQEEPDETDLTITERR